VRPCLKTKQNNKQKPSLNYICNFSVSLRLRHTHTHTHTHIWYLDEIIDVMGKNQIALEAF
jgi:hypothetical protein